MDIIIIKLHKNVEQFFFHIHISVWPPKITPNHPYRIIIFGHLEVISNLEIGIKETKKIEPSNPIRIYIYDDDDDE